MTSVAAAPISDVMHEQLDYLIEVDRVHGENRQGECSCSLCCLYRATEKALMGLFGEPPRMLAARGRT